MWSARVTRGESAEREGVVGPCACGAREVHEANPRSAKAWRVPKTGSCRGLLWLNGQVSPKGKTRDCGGQNFRQKKAAAARLQHEEYTR